MDHPARAQQDALRDGVFIRSAIPVICIAIAMQLAALP
jgi:hypothetical protein